MDRIIFCVFYQKDNSIYRELLHKYFPLDKAAPVKSIETPDNASSLTEEAMPTLQKSVTEPVGQHSLTHSLTHTPTHSLTHLCPACTNVQLVITKTADVFTLSLVCCVQVKCFTMHHHLLKKQCPLCKRVSQNQLVSTHSLTHVNNHNKMASSKNALEFTLSSFENGLSLDSGNFSGLSTTSSASFA